MHSRILKLSNPRACHRRRGHLLTSQPHTMQKSIISLLLAIGITFSAQAQTQAQGLLLGKSGIELNWKHFFYENNIAWNTVRFGGKYQNLIGGVSYTNVSAGAPSTNKFSIDKLGLDIGYQIPFSSHFGMLLNGGYMLWSDQFSNGKVYRYAQPNFGLSLYGSFEPQTGFFIKPVAGLSYRNTAVEGKLAYIEWPFILGAGVQIPVDKRSSITFLPMVESLSYFGLKPATYFSTTFGFSYRL
jgi:hypothetical protein